MPLNREGLLQLLLALAKRLFIHDDFKHNYPRKRHLLQTALETLVHTQYVINMLLIRCTLFSGEQNGLSILLGISSVFLDILSKFGKTPKQTRASIIKFFNSIIVEVLFVLVLEKIFQCTNLIKSPTIFNLLTNFILTTINLSLGYLSLQYLMILFFMAFNFAFILNFRNNGLFLMRLCQDIEKINDSFNISLFASNWVSFLIVALIIRKINSDHEFRNQISKASPFGKAILKKKNKQILFANEELIHIMDINGMDMCFDSLNTCLYNQILKPPNHTVYLLNPMENSDAASGKSSQRITIQFSKILEALKHTPSKVLTFYTSLASDEEKGNTKIKRINRVPILEAEDKFSIWHTEGNLLDDQFHYYELKISHLNWDKYKDKYYYLQFNDITELQKTLDNERQIEFKTKMLHSFSHELRTPINISKNMCDLMMMDEAMPISIKDKYAIIIQESVNQLDVLIQDIIDFLKIESLQFHPETSKFCLKELSEEVVKTMLKKSELNDIQIILNTTQSDNYNVFTDKMRLKRVLLNILSYLITISKKCSLEILIDVECVGCCNFSLTKTQVSKEIVPERIINIIPETGLVKTMSVQPDNDFGIIISRILLEKLKGNGIAGYSLYCKEEEGKIFEFTAALHSDSSQRLSLEPSIARFDMYNFKESDIFLSRREKKFLTNPSNSKIQEIINLNFEKTKSNLKDPKLSSSCPRVLVVDDDHYNLLTIGLLLEKLNLYSLKTSNGLEAISCLNTYHKEHTLKCAKENCIGIELIIMDIMMPVMNGLDSSKVLLKMMADGEIPVIPIIACTANDSKDIVEVCEKIGMKDVLSKPISLDNLRSALSGILQRQTL